MRFFIFIPLPKNLFFDWKQNDRVHDRWWVHVINLLFHNSERESLKIFEFQPQLLVYHALRKRNATYMLMSWLHQSIMERIIFAVSRPAPKSYSPSRCVKKIVYWPSAGLFYSQFAWFPRSRRNFMFVGNFLDPPLGQQCTISVLHTIFFLLHREKI